MSDVPLDDEVVDPADTGSPRTEKRVSDIEWTEAEREAVRDDIRFAVAQHPELADHWRLIAALAVSTVGPLANARVEAAIKTATAEPESPPPFAPDWRLVGHVEGNEDEIKKAQEHARRVRGEN